MQQIRRDTIKTVRHNKLNIDTMSWEAAHADTSFAQSNRESFQAVIATPPKPKIVLTAFDTIQPCDVSLFPAATYYIPKTHIVRNEPQTETPMNYDILANGLVLTFTLLLTVKYALGCVPAWTNLIQDLRKV
jgi:hypothetical protein